ncbi:small acidic protein family-domain-containing protein [Hypoxylon sp. NC0597]|nr:small acidic protein family-domain-containing protein [Hypoxylon sp. NC0597]
MESSDPSPWKKLDPAKLRRDAEAKEAKLKRQQEQRIARAEARKEKRHAKSEAKQARKANVGRAAKWNAERKAADKLKKLANRPHKQEKRRRRLRLRAEKLEAQAIKMMAEAQKARARADLLDEQKAKEEAEKNKLSREIQQMAANPENGDFIPLDDAQPATTEAADGEENATHTKKESKKQKKKDKKTQDETAGPSEPDAEASEAEKEKKHKKDKKKSEKRKREAEGDDAHEQPNGATNPDDAGGVEVPKEKKKKRKLEDATGEAGPQEETTQAEAPKEKKDKKKKHKEKHHAEEYVSTATAEGGANTNGGEQWNAQALEGDDKRKEKFLRLLGAKKSNGTATADGRNTPGASKAYLDQVQHDLERQFDTGMRMKHEGHGQKRGLGA